MDDTIKKNEGNDGKVVKELDDIRNMPIYKDMHKIKGVTPEQAAGARALIDIMIKDFSRFIIMLRETPDLQDEVSKSLGLSSTGGET